MYIDKAIITCKAGNGGDGAVSWRREKYVPRGGPDGGDGGNGGDIFFEACEGMSTLYEFKYNKKFFAKNGENGKGSNKYGKSGEDLVIRIPCGTVIKDYISGKIIADMFYKGQKVLVLKGGKGGRGNAKFATAVRKSPAFSELGETTEVVKLVLELKTIADVGLIGYPNVGKSTLLSVISRAKPEIANYPFTTLSPVLGVVKYDHENFVVADIPGLIEGASQGQGLGHEFLRHIERVRLFVHVIDISEQEGRNAVDDYKVIRNELSKYSKKLTTLPEIIVLNKADVGNLDEKIENFKKHISKDVYVISAITKKGIKELVDKMFNELSKIPQSMPEKYEPFVYEPNKGTEFEIEKVDDNFIIKGGLIEKLARRVVLTNQESFRWFQKMLKTYGVMEKLYEMGIKDGDTVSILDHSFTYYE